jgi:hypothetical protein
VSRPLRAIGVAAAAALCAAAAAAEDDATATIRLARGNDALARLAELAGGTDFYLVLEPDSLRLALELQGARLREFPLESIAAATPRVAFLPRPADPSLRDGSWRTRAWRGGELDPPRVRDRIEIDAEPPDPDRPEGSVEIPIPPTPEEAIAVPPRYFVRFTDGLVVEIAATRPGLRSSASFEDRLAAAGLRRTDPWRLRLRMAPADADALYRSLPPSVGLVVLPGDVAVLR